jgi:hypothetical protein
MKLHILQADLEWYRRIPSKFGVGDAMAPAGDPLHILVDVYGCRIRLLVNSTSKYNSLYGRHASHHGTHGPSLPPLKRSKLYKAHLRGSPARDSIFLLIC